MEWLEIAFEVLNNVNIIFSTEWDGVMFCHLLHFIDPFLALMLIYSLCYYGKLLAGRIMSFLYAYYEILEFLTSHALNWYTTI